MDEMCATWQYEPKEREMESNVAKIPQSVQCSAMRNEREREKEREEL